MTGYRIDVGVTLIDVTMIKDQVSVDCLIDETWQKQSKSISMSEIVVSECGMLSMLASCETVWKWLQEIGCDVMEEC